MTSETSSKPLCREYRRDDLRGVWVRREMLSDEWMDCPDDPVVIFLEERVMPSLRREFYSTLRGGFIRDVMFTAWTDPRGRLLRRVEGLARITPLNSRYMDARIELQAVIEEDGTVRHRATVRAKSRVGSRFSRVRTYMRPIMDVLDDISCDENNAQ